MSFLPSGRWLRAALATAFVLGLAAGASAHESSQVLLRLDDVSGGSAGHAHAFVEVRLGEEEAVLRLHAWRLARGGHYELRADDVPFADFDADGRGRARVEVDLRSVPLDPRGRLLSVVRDGAELLAGVVSGPMEPRLSFVRERTQLEASDAAGSGRALVRFHKSFFGVGRLVVYAMDAPPGFYEVQLDGAALGHLVVDRRGRGRADFVEEPAHRHGRGWGWHRLFRHPRLQPLDEDPRYRQLALVRDGETLFEGPVKARIEGLEAEPEPDPEPEPPTCTPGLVELRMNGSGDGALRHGFDDACRGLLEIELAFVPSGDYEVFRNGASLGTFAVGFSGLARFATDPVAGELPLDAPIQAGDVVEVGPVGQAPVLSLTIP